MILHFGVTASMDEQTAYSNKMQSNGSASEIARPPVAEVSDIRLSFASNEVLKGVSLSVDAGETRALVGRNGAGKSTLVGILTGLLAPNAGAVRLSGDPAPAMGDRSAWRAKVACVYQRSNVVPSLTVAENLLLNALPTKPSSPIIDWRSVRSRAQQMIEEWGIDIDVDAMASTLNVEQRQIIEIARALMRGSKFIILDEPTAQLEGPEVERLFDRMKRMQQTGVSFLFISHYLDEIYEICQTVTVLRDGRVAAEGDLAHITKDDVIEAMVGQTNVKHLRDLSTRSQPDEASVRPALEIIDLSISGKVHGVSLSIRPGECVGLTGLVSSGKELVANAIVGIIPPDSGEIRLSGNALTEADVTIARSKGIGFVPRDRHTQGILPQLSVGENITFTVPDRFGRWGFVNAAARDRLAGQMIDEFSIVASSSEQPISELSGGNQQKAMMARALASDPRILVLCHPTQGVDVAAREALFDLIENERKRGAAILVVTDDLDELVICDRVLTMFRGQIAEEFGIDRSDAEIVASIEGIVEK